MWLIFIFINVQYAFQSIFWNILLVFLVIIDYQTYWFFVSAQLDYPRDFFFPFIIVAYMVFQCSAFWNTVLPFLNTKAKLGWLFPQVIREQGGSNQVFIQFYLLSQTYLFQKFIPFSFFFFFGFGLLFILGLEWLFSEFFDWENKGYFDFNNIRK